MNAMKVVVVKSPKMFTGLLRMMFGIKKSETI
ncbi:MAG: stage V sporulation protein SpoVM [Oscillospiraceae bacterium]|nr:stage V sporulation protein SpoVM [Oscillospiraceae bacterium]